jgi:hypothetical protein
VFAGDQAAQQGRTAVQTQSRLTSGTGTLGASTSSKGPSIARSPVGAAPCGEKLELLLRQA